MKVRRWRDPRTGRFTKPPTPPAGVKTEPSGAPKAPGQQFEEMQEVQRKLNIYRMEKTRQMDKQELMEEAERALEELRNRDIPPN